MNKRIAIYDAATDGFGEKAKLACVAVWFFPEDEWRLFSGLAAKPCVDALNSRQLIIGHNVKAFDNPIIVRHARCDIFAPVFDFLSLIREQSDEHGWKLDEIARAMGVGQKHMDGAKEAELVKQGKLIEVADSALADVRLLKRVLQKVRLGMGTVNGKNGSVRLPASVYGQIEF